MAAIVFVLIDKNGKAYMRDGSLKSIPTSTKHGSFYPLHITIGYIPNKENAAKIVSSLTNDPYAGSSILASEWKVTKPIKMKNSIKTTVVLNNDYERNALLANMVTNFVNPIISRALPSFKPNTRDEHIEIGAENMASFTFPDSFYLKYALSANQNIFYVHNTTTSSTHMKSSIACRECSVKTGRFVEEAFINSHMMIDHVYCSVDCQEDANNHV
jgi:hypothetical protein